MRIGQGIELRHVLQTHLRLMFLCDIGDHAAPTEAVPIFRKQGACSDGPVVVLPFQMHGQQKFAKRFARSHGLLQGTEVFAVRFEPVL